jgi:shikimate dehydrogenase
VVEALGRAGAAEVVVVNRTRDKAAVAAALAGCARVGEPAEVSTADVVVNATSVGLGTQHLPLDPTLLRAHHVVVDLVYHPLRTALLAAAEAVGARPVDGLGMLVHQAGHQVRLWTGCAPPLADMRGAALAALAARS